jgi:ABC-type lipoprotein release transport system permease subunit
LSETALPGRWSRRQGHAGGIPIWRLAWRNLWRNPRRTWLTSGSIGFAVWLLVFAMSMQDGSFEVMIDNAAQLLSGHVQLQHPGFHDDPRLEYRLEGVEELIEQVHGLPHVTAVLPRLSSFALVSVGERGYGAQIMGVDPRREAAASSLPTRVAEGRYPKAPGEAFMGEILARNLGLVVGDEVVLLGAALQGGVAAAVAEVVGTFATGQVELDRSLLQIHIDDFRAAWNLGPEDAHLLVILVDRAFRSEVVADALRTTDHAALDWRALMPEAEQTIAIKRLSTQLFFALVAVIVGFSVVNTFMMTVFERTREFGMLMALGMRHGAIVRQLCLEAFWLATLGVAVGLTLAGVLVGMLAVTGMPLPADAAEMLARYNMPDRMYPAFSVWAAAVASFVMYGGTQLAVLVPALRVRRLRPVEALRARE